MKKYYVLFAALFAFCFLSSTVFAYDYPYASFSLGLVQPTDSDISYGDKDGEITYKSGFSFSAAFGSRFEERLRGEFEFAATVCDFKDASFDDYKAKNGDTNVFSLLANGYLDFVNDSPFTPYFSAGFGAARVAFSDLTFKKDGVPSQKVEAANDTVFAYQLGAGTSFAVSSQLLFDLKYRYFGTSKPSFSNSDLSDKIKSELTTHTLFLGVRYLFW